MQPKYLQPAMLNGLELKNRLIKAGTYEGKTPLGQIADRYRQFHLAIAEGGAAMTTLGYCATEPDGRINENMLYMDEYIRGDLSQLINDIHQAGSKVSGQMGHCGGFSKNKQLQRKRPMGPQRGINMLGFQRGMLFTDAMTEKDIDAMVQSYHDAALFMKSVGFDCLEIHLGHGYGLCQFMSPKTNARTDNYGGSLINRMRLPLRCLEAVRKAVGDDFPVIGKISMTEGVRGGIHYDESVEIAKMLDQAGIDGIITSGGTSTMNPMIMFRGDNILKPMLKAEKNLLMQIILRMVGKSMFRNYEYKELYFLEPALRIREAVNCNMIYIGGASTADSFDTLMGHGFDFVQLGRSLISDPAFVNQLAADLAKGKTAKSRCLHCNECVATIEHPLGIHCTRFTIASQR
ncbi:MAG: NADH:flavin oxidoreductase [Pseudomonadales bacterium]|nr:NADH:flavin oxidoreductase [Pseudomonadales bacterium]